MIKAAFFDLFFTLIVPTYQETDNEFSILHISANEWEHYAENASLYEERALGKVKGEYEIINKITAKIPFKVSDIQKEKLLDARCERMKNALNNTSEEILNTLSTLRKRNIKICLISNADTIDCKYWAQSKLSALFDDAVFSCNVGLLKPDKEIYRLAMQRFNMNAEECIFVGDGGSSELFGAKAAGMTTVFTEALEKKDEIRKNTISQYADYHIEHFNELINII